MARVNHELWQIGDLEIPVRIYWEKRWDSRVSIAKDAVHLRLPSVNQYLPFDSSKKWATKWLSRQFKKDPSLKDRFKLRIYQSGDIIKTHFHSYRLDVRFSHRESSIAKWRAGDIIFNLNRDLNPRERSTTVHDLIAKVIGGHEKPRIVGRIKEINAYCFNNLSISGVRIKNNTSNWGSCSAKGNINISVRTLFAPARVQDYIYVHELAHRVELNHSSAYWNIVKQVMPDYKKCEQWLKDNAELCEF